MEGLKRGSWAEEGAGTKRAEARRQKRESVKGRGRKPRNVEIWNEESRVEEGKERKRKGRRGEGRGRRDEGREGKIKECNYPELDNLSVNFGTLYIV